MIKNFTLTSLVLVLILSILVSCAGGSVTQPDQVPEERGTTNTVEAGMSSERPDFGPAFSQAPWWHEPQTFSMWMPIGRLAGVLPTWGENLIYQTMAEITNVTIDFLHPPSGSETESFNLMVASGDLPDAILHGWLGAPGGPMNFINNGTIIPLNDLMAQYSPHTMAWFQERPDVLREAMLDDGTLYALPSVYYHLDLAVHTGPIIRADMAELIGVTWDDFPMTISQWEEMLIAVRDHPELGGQGVIPFSFMEIQHFNNPIFVGAWNIAQEWFQRDGIVMFGASQPEYQEFLQLLNRWWDMGLIDPEFAANTQAMMDEKVLGDRVFSFFGGMGFAITRYTGLARPNNPDFQLIPVHFPALNPGEVAPLGHETPWFQGGVAVTSQARDPAMILRYFDYFYSDEGHIFSNWGIQGMTFDYDSGGNRFFLPLITENPDGLARDQAMARYTIWQAVSPVYKKRDVLEQRDSLPEQLRGRRYWMEPPNYILMPPVTPTSDEATEFANIMIDINNFYREQATAIIMGQVDLDSGFENMVNTLYGMGLGRAVELRQEALNRYLARPMPQFD